MKNCKLLTLKLSRGMLMTTWMFFVCLINVKLNAQELQNCYEYLNIMEFINTKIENDTNFVRQIYGNCTYPKKAKDLELETVVEIMVINHQDKQIEVIVLNHMNVFDSLKEQVLKGLNNLNIDQETPFITRFYIRFHLTNPDNPATVKNKYFHGLENGNSILLLDYRSPLIDID